MATAAGARMPRMMVASIRDSAAECGGEDLGLGARGGAERDEREAEDQRGARNESSGAADAHDNGGLGGVGAVVGRACG
jgi:hypothetical protein